MPNSFEHLLPPSWKAQVTTWLAEDTPSFDYGGYVVGEVHREAFLLGKGRDIAVLAGAPFATEIFTQLGCEYVAQFNSWINLIITEWNGMFKRAMSSNPSSTLRQLGAKRVICCSVNELRSICWPDAVGSRRGIDRSAICA